MDLKRLGIAVLSTALLLATNTLAAANHKVDSPPKSPQASENQLEQPDQVEIDGMQGNAEILAGPIESSEAAESAPSNYPWDDPTWEEIQYED